MKQLLGLDIHDDRLTAVVVHRKGKSYVLTSCIAVPFMDPEHLNEALVELAALLPAGRLSASVGLPLHSCSFRNLSLPFSEPVKIRQILPFELEEQMLFPVDESVLAFDAVPAGPGQSHVLVTALEKHRLQHLLESLVGAGVDPMIMEPSIWALCRTAIAGRRENLLLLNAGVHGMSMALCSQGKVLFLRYLAYPEQMFTSPPFRFSPEGLDVLHEQEAATCVRALCASIQTSMDYFCQESGLSLQPARVLLSGGLAAYPAFPELIRECLHMEPSLLDLTALARVSLDPGLAESWRPSSCDRALALALGLLEKQHPLNLRRDAFSHRSALLQGRKWSAAAGVSGLFLFIGWVVFLFLRVAGLQREYDQGREQILALFKESFPGVQRIVDPYAQMKAALEGSGGAATALPVFSGEKRVLPILADISSRIPDTLSLHVSRLVIDQEGVQIRGTTDAFNNVDVISNQLAGSPLYRQAKIISATADKDKGGVRFEIRLDLGARQ